MWCKTGTGYAQAVRIGAIEYRVDATGGYEIHRRRV